MTNLRTAAVIGLGAMGRGIARRLLDQGHRVVVWNRSRGPANELAAAGALPAADPADAAGRADVSIVMVSDDDALHAVTEGPRGVAGGIGDSTLLQMSTVSPTALRRLEATLPARAELLDAPVLGSIAEVGSGTLQVFAGGSAAAVERNRATLEALGTVIHVGPLGSGTAAKLVANSALFGVLALLGETLALAGRLGLPMDVALRVLESTPLSAQAKRRRPALESGEYPARFTLALAAKDAGLILSAAADHGVDLRLGAAGLSWLTEADETSSGPCDYTAVLGHILGRHPAAPAGGAGGHDGAGPHGDTGAHDETARR